MHIAWLGLACLPIDSATDWNWFAGQCVSFFSDYLPYYEPHNLPLNRKKSYSAAAMIKTQVPIL